MVPGADATEDWNFGNVYLNNLNNPGQWKKYRTIPKGLHIFDMTFYQGKLYCSSGSAVNFDDKNQMAMGCIYSSADSAKTWDLVYMSSADNVNVNRIDQLIPLKGKLYAFFHSFYATTRNDLPAEFQAVIPGDSLRQLLIMKSNPQGKNDILEYDGQQWQMKDIIQQENIALINPFPFNDKILLECTVSECAYSTDGRFPLINNQYYLYDGEKAEEIKLPFTKLIDSKIYKDHLYLLARKGKQPVLAILKNDDTYELFNLPDKLNLLSLEIKENLVYIGSQDGNLYLCDLKKDISEQPLEYPLSFKHRSDIPANDNLYYFAVKKRNDLIKPVEYHIEKKADILSVTTENISEFIIFPEGKLSSLFINGQKKKIRQDSLFTAYLISLKDKISIKGMNLLSKDFHPEPVILTAIKNDLKVDNPALNLACMKSLADVLNADYVVNIPASFTSGLKKGPVTIDNIYRIYYRNKIARVQLKGKEWKEIINKTNEKKELVFISGNSQELISNPELNDEQLYSITMNDYIYEKLCQYSGRKIKADLSELTTAQAMILWLQKGNLIISE